MLLIHTILLHAILLHLIHAETSTPNTGDQPQAFTFSYPSSPGPNSVVLPITPSCPSPLIISALSSTNNPKTSDPKAPYTMVALVHEQLMDGAGVLYERMYARSMDVGNMAAARSFNHPWANGTQFIGCVWASNGVSGGCQDLVTISTSDLTASAYANDTSQCRGSVTGSWVTSPSSTLDVTVEGAAGLLASNGWPASCSDIRIQPKNGTAPFTLLIAPAFHPPVNITSSSTAAMNYTIRLTHGQAFMLGVFDSAGNSFAFGPLHAGTARDLSCLAVATGGSQVTTGSSTSLSTGTLVGGIIGSLVIGAVGAVLVMWGLALRKRRQLPPRDKHDLFFDEALNTRPYSFRTHSDQSYTNPKPLDPYDDSPHRVVPFESPATLYDPHLGATQTSISTSRPAAGSSFAVISRSDFGVGQSLIDPSGSSSSRGTVSQAGETPSRNSKLSPEARQSYALPPASGLASSRFSAGGEGAQPPPALRLIGSPTPRSPSSPRWDGGSDGEGYGDPFRSGKSGPTPSQHGQRPSSGGGSQEDDGHRLRKVYVVHSDGGGGDVHIQLPDGDARVIELPPNYRDDPSRSPKRGIIPPIATNRPRSESNSNLSPVQGRVASFGPRPPRPSSAHSSHTGLSQTSPTTEHAPRTAYQISLPPSGSGVKRTKSEVERVEAAYFNLDPVDEGGQIHPLSPSPPVDYAARQMTGDGKIRQSESMQSLSSMTQEEIRARAEAALAEKARFGIS